MTSYKGEVLADSSGKWVANMLRFATQNEAQTYIHDLSIRWTAVRETRVVKSDDKVNARLSLNGGKFSLEHLS